MPEPRHATEAAFDTRAATYSRSDSWHVRYAQRLVDLAAPTPGSRILDAATGPGFAAIAAARATGHTGHVVGVDISAGMLAHARQSPHPANVTFIQADTTSLPQYADSSFDVVLCSAGLLYLPVKIAVREWHRLLAPGGLVAFSTMREGFPIVGRVFREHARRYGLHLTDPATSLGTEARCVDALQQAGLTPVTTVAETIRFAPSDLTHAWDAHAHGSYRDAIATLTSDQLDSFHDGYVSALAALVDEDEEHSLSAEVIYAFGRKLPGDSLR